MKKSELLEALLSFALDLAKLEGKESASAGFFVYGALLTAVKEKNGRDVPFLAGNQEEWKATKEALPLPKSKIPAAALAMRSALRGGGENFSMDALLLRSTLLNLEMSFKDVLTADILVGRLANELPTYVKDALQVQAGKGVAEEEEAGAKPSGEATDTDVKITFDDLFTQPSSQEGSAQKPPAETLAKLVSDTKNMQQILSQSVLGQDQAINVFVSGYFQSELQALSLPQRRKPRATFLFAGPPGVGKTFLAEKVAATLGLPFCRFDMSEYSDKEASIEFCGSDKVYKNGKAGNVTSFVAENPHSVLLFDEIEKVHVNVINLFLQILDAGRLRDNYTDEEVSFKDTILIFTTNAGHQLYEDDQYALLSSIPRKTVIKALRTDIDPEKNAPYFPAAICSRFASGNVVMFNHLSAGDLLKITTKELEKNAKALSDSLPISLSIHENVPAAILYAEGGKADARTVTGRASAFIYEELYELLRLVSAENHKDDLGKLEKVCFDVVVPKDNEEIRSLFVDESKPEILLFADEAAAEGLKSKVRNIQIHATSSLEEAKEILFKNEISLILCDVTCNPHGNELDVLNSEDILSDGGDFFLYAAASTDIALCILQPQGREINEEELVSFTKAGAVGIIRPETDKNVAETVFTYCAAAYRRKNLLRLAKANKILFYKTAQTISEDGKVATVSLFDCKLKLSVSAEDSGSILSDVSKPNTRFADVIGAKDAKDELAYFVRYLKNPTEYMRKGVKAPKGILLYGPPGTGKTMLAKAMAGESDVTFIAAEGNQFLQRYVGQGAEMVHKLFRTARRYAPSILFIDEIDAIGKNRNSDSAAAETSADVLTAFLTEMDGFKNNSAKPVFVLAATNYTVEQSSARSLDAALLRRFDRRLLVDLPDRAEREQFLKLYMSRHPALRISEEEWKNIAMRSVGMSLADLDSVLEYAMRNAIKSENGEVDDAMLEEAFESFNGGESKAHDADALLRTARHEAGHALMCMAGGETPSYLTIVARGNHGGYMQHADNENKGVYTKADLLARITTALGGRAAELVCYGDENGLTTGASGDLHSATRLAREMICSYGMDESFGLGVIDSLDGEMAGKVREGVNRVLADALASARACIAENRAALDALVEALLAKTHLKGDEMQAIYEANKK
ncbi:MAG: AAA family ATPase [Clostridia bacterium]|nr:AAA family ATPase [Clostridia bacterium]